MTKKNLTYVAIVLDESGSMLTVRDETIAAVNAFIESQKKVEGECKVTLQKFSSDVPFPVFVDADVKETPALTTETYNPHGWTALYDAIGSTIQGLGLRLACLPEEERPSQVIIVVQTDGDENNSKFYHLGKIKEMMEHQKAIYSWDFVFLGVGPDAFSTGGLLGFDANKTLSYDTKFMRQTLGAVSNYVSSARVGGAKNATFSVADRAASVGGNK